MSDKAKATHVIDSVLQVFLGAAGYFLSDFVINPELKSLRFLATGAIMTGFVLGGLVATARSKLVIGISAIINIVVMFFCSMGYVHLSTGGQADVIVIWSVAGLLTLAFFCIGFVIPLAGSPARSEITGPST